MCLICVEFMKGRMNIREVQRAANEIVVTSEDDKEVLHVINLMEARTEEELELIIESKKLRLV